MSAGAVGTLVLVQYSPRRRVVARIIGYTGSDAIVCGLYKGKCFAKVLPVVGPAATGDVTEARHFGIGRLAAADPAP